jgi:Predicted membrane protein (DUF2232)
MFRNLTAIEIAEGALLADIAVVFHFLALFMPIGSNFFSQFNFTIFAILVLRRGTYVGLMGMCVALFLMCVLLGPQGIFIMLAEGLGGIFLGYTMKHRYHPLLILTFGIIFGTIFTYLAILGFTWLSGVGLGVYLRSAQHAYQTVAALAGHVAQQMGLGSVWQQQVYPPANALIVWGFQHWTIALLGFLLLAFCPIVAAIYAVVNAFVLLFGYDVRPFLGRRLGRWRKALRARAARRMGEMDEAAADNASFD